MRLSPGYFVSVIGLSFFVGSFSQAFALTQSTSMNVLDPDRRVCTKLTSAISDLSITQGTAQVIVESRIDGCGSLKIQPAGWIEGDNENIMKWNNTTGTWDVCFYGNVTGFVKTTNQSNSLTVTTEPVRRCGNGYYANNAEGYVWNGLNRWVGTKLWSGYYWLST